MSVGSIGELKNASPTSFIDFESVYVRRTLAHLIGRWTNDTWRPWYVESATDEYWLLFRYVDTGRQPLLVPAATQIGMFWLTDIKRFSPRKY
jgi:hypothetical protein